MTAKRLVFQPSADNAAWVCGCSPASVGKLQVAVCKPLEVRHTQQMPVNAYKPKKTENGGEWL